MTKLKSRDCRILRNLIALTLALSLLVGCQKEKKDNQQPLPQSISVGSSLSTLPPTVYDGSYTFLFSTGGVPTTWTSFLLKEGKFSATVIPVSEPSQQNSSSEEAPVQIGGSVSSEGKLRFASSDPFSTLSGEGLIRGDGDIEGDYRAGKAQSRFLGVRRPSPEGPHLYDGTYQVDLFREGVKAVSTGLVIQESTFEGTLHGKLLNETFNVRGFVSKGGVIVVGGVTGDQNTQVMAHAKIDPQRHIEGRYFLFKAGEIKEGTIDGFPLGSAQEALPMEGTYVALSPAEGLPVFWLLLGIKGETLQGTLGQFADPAEFPLQGTVQPSGDFQLESSGPVQAKNTFQVKGSINTDRQMGGRYTLSQTSGTLFGLRQPAIGEQHAYDGLYRVSFQRSGTEAASAEIQVEQSRFRAKVVSTLLKEVFEAGGFVGNTGQMILTGLAGNKGTHVVVKADIDSRHRISGVYYLKPFDQSLTEGILEGQQIQSSQLSSR